MRRSMITGAIGYAAFSGFALCAAAADLTPTYVPMQPIQPASLTGGFYLGSVNAAAFPNHTSFDIGGGGARVRSTYDTGFYSGLRVGYSFAPALWFTPRLELEGGYGTQSVDAHTINGFRVNNGNSFGSTDIWQGYLNGYVDVNLASIFGAGRSFPAFTPYFGGGVGVANVNLSKQGVSATGVVMNNDNTGFAYHLDAGIGVRLESLGLTNAFFQGTTLDIGYRYSDVPNLRFTAVDGTRSKTDFTANMVTIGFRKQF